MSGVISAIGNALQAPARAIQDINPAKRINFALSPNPLVSLNPKNAYVPAGSILSENQTALGQIKTALSGTPDDPGARATAAAAAIDKQRQDRLQAMAGALGGESSQSLSSFSDHDLDLLGRQGDFFAAHSKSILQRRAQPGRAQTILSSGVRSF